MSGRKLRERIAELESANAAAEDRICVLEKAAAERQIADQVAANKAWGASIITALGEDKVTVKVDLTVDYVAPRRRDYGDYWSYTSWYAPPVTTLTATFNGPHDALCRLAKALAPKSVTP